MIIEDFYNMLLTKKLAIPEGIQGCTQEEVEKIEKHFKVTLPGLYKDFLLRMGHGAGEYLVGTDIFYKYIFDLKEGAEELLEEDNAEFKLPEHVFVFASHQGYQYMYFDLADNMDDPPVYYYLEGSGAPEKKWDSFSRFLLTYLA